MRVCPTSESWIRVVTVTREDYAAFGSQNYDRYDSLGGARYVDEYEVKVKQRRSYYKSFGSRYSRPAPDRGGHEWRITFEGSIPTRRRRRPYQLMEMSRSGTACALQ